MNFILTLVMFINLSFAGLPTQADQVEIIKAEDEMTYENIPRISKVFKGARDVSQREELQKACQEFVIDELMKAEAPYFRVWCTLTKDIVVREYALTANLLIRNWP